MLIGTFKTIVNELYYESLNITFMKIKKYIYIYVRKTNYFIVFS